MKGKVSEIFESIQGEGLYCGEKQLFVRFFGCNRDCCFCDTPQRVYKELSAAEVMAELRKYPGVYHSVSFTGGEPLLQKDFLKDLLLLTRGIGHKTYLETNATLVDNLLELIELIDYIALDFKLPSSTKDLASWDEHRRFLKCCARKKVFIKAVICADTDEQDIITAIKIIREAGKSIPLFLQPNSFEQASDLLQKLNNFKKICVENELTVFILPQMHKIMGVK